MERQDTRKRIDHKHGEIRNGLLLRIRHLIYPQLPRTTKINFLTVNLGAILDRIYLVTPFRCAVVPASALHFRLLNSSTSFTYLDREVIEYIRI
jgi:hypothetical protein